VLFRSTTVAINSGQVLNLYANGFDADGNFTGNASVNWATTGSLSDADLGTPTGSSNTTFVPTTIGSGTITISTGDATGLITVSAGSLAELRIQTVRGDGGAELVDNTLNADQTLTVFAEGYDASGNYLSSISSDWSGTGVVSGNVAPTTAADSTTFTASTAGSGKILAVDNAGGVIDDDTGVITVTAGATVSTLIMSEPNNEGSEVTTVAINSGQVLTLYANGFDADGNFTGNASVNWATTGSLSDADLGTLTGSSNTTFVPTTIGSGTITISTGDATGLITVSTGTLARIEIRTATSGEIGRAHV